MPTLDELRAIQAPKPPTVTDLAGANAEQVASNPGFLQRAITEGKKTTVAAGANVASGFLGANAGLNATLANTFDVLNNAAQYIHERTGLSKGGAFKKAERYFRGESLVLAKRATELSSGQDIGSKINRIIGGLPAELAQAGVAAAAGGPVAGFAGLGALQRADEGVQGAVRGAIEGATLGSIFKGASGLAPVPRAATVAAGAAAVGALTGAPFEEVALQAGTLGLLAGGFGPKGARRIELKRPPSLPPEPVEKPRLRLTSSGTIIDTKASSIVEVLPRDSKTVQRANAFLGRDYSDLEVPNKVVNLNLNRIEGPKDFKQAVTTLTELYRGEINDARRNTVTLQQTERMAEDLGMSVSDLMKRRRGQAFNAEEAVATRVLNRSVLEDWKTRADKVRSGKATDTDKIEFLRSTALAEESLKHTLGMTAEAGRALSSFRVKVGSSTLQMKHIRGLIQQINERGTGGPEELADMVAELDTPQGLARFADGLGRATTGQKFLEVWINGLLSSPQTHAVNILSNQLVALWSVPETMLAAGISAVRGAPAGERVFLREGLARLYAVQEAGRDGLRLAGRVLQTGEPFTHGDKTELPRRVAVEHPKLGELVRLPSRVLLAEDAFFQAMGARQEVKAMAMRKGLSEGLKGVELARRVRQLEANPPAKVVDAAVANARTQTFTEALGPGMAGFLRFTNSHPAFKLFFPFIRTPTNILKFSAKRSPLGLFMRDVKTELAKGGTARDIALARMALGSAVMAGIAAWAADGTITGSGPADPELRAAWLASGRRPFSVKIGDTYYSYSRLEPMATLFGVAADFTDIVGHLEQATADELGASLVSSVVRNITSKSFLQGMSALGEALADPQRFLPRTVDQMAGSLVPNIVNTINRTQFDPVLRDARGAIDEVRSRIPGLSQTLPPQRNIWGESILLTGGLGPDMVSPIYTNKQILDPASEEVVRLKAELTKPARKLGGVELTPGEYDNFLAQTGQLGKRLIDTFVRAPYYPRIPDPLKREIIQDSYNEGRSIARSMLLAQMARGDPERFKKATVEKGLVGELMKR